MVTLPAAALTESVTQRREMSSSVFMMNMMKVWRNKADNQKFSYTKTRTDKCVNRKCWFKVPSDNICHTGRGWRRESTQRERKDEEQKVSLSRFYLVEISVSCNEDGSLLSSLYTVFQPRLASCSSPQHNH